MAEKGIGTLKDYITLDEAAMTLARHDVILKALDRYAAELGNLDPAVRGRCVRSISCANARLAR